MQMVFLQVLLCEYIYKVDSCNYGRGLALWILLVLVDYCKLTHELQTRGIKAK
jgi:hypothetical protein